MVLRKYEEYDWDIEQKFMDGMNKRIDWKDYLWQRKFRFVLKNLGLLNTTGMRENVRLKNF